MLCRRRFLRGFALALLMGGLLAGCRHGPQDQPNSGRTPTRDGGDGGGY